MVWLPLLVTIAECLFQVSLAIVMGVRIWRDVPAKSTNQPARTRQPDMGVVLATLAVAASSGVILFFAGWLLLALGPQAGGFGAAIFLAHAVVFPILWLACIRVFQECLRPVKRRQLWRRIDRSRMNANATLFDSVSEQDEDDEANATTESDHELVTSDISL